MRLCVGPNAIATGRKTRESRACQTGARTSSHTLTPGLEHNNFREPLSPRKCGPSDSIAFRGWLDDGRLWLEHIYPFPGQTGAPLGASMIEETTAQKYEAAQHETLLRTRLDAMPHHVWTVPAGGGSVDWFNRRWYEYTGLSEADVAVDGGQDTVHPDDATGLAHIYETGLREGRAFEAEVRLRGRNGQHRWFALRCEPVLNGQQISGWIGTNTDIHDRKLAEETTREREARFRWLAEATPLLVWIFDADSRLAYVNPAYTEVTGLSLDQARSGEVNIVHPDDLPALNETAARSLAQGSMFRVEVRMRHVDRDAYRWYLHQAVPIREGDRISAWYGTSTDIQAQKEAELALRAAHESQRRFVSDAAHELRAPLMVIEGNLGILRGYALPEDERAEVVADVHHESQRLRRLVNDMLDVARGDAGTEMRMEPVALADALEGAWRMARVLSGAHSMELGEIEPATVLGDADRLKQLAFILLENAIKYSPPDGTVRLAARSDSNRVEFRVSDTGPGIPAAALERVFERFYRGDWARTRGSDPGGTGLGLPIARQIAEAHGGTVHLENGLGGGTIAVVRLPLVGGT